MVKRAFDIIASSFLLVILSPLMTVIAFIVLCRLGRPILFVQERPGLHGRVFRMFKFRSMHNWYDDEGCLLPNAERTDVFGKWLRSMSLDELPELYNVFRGDMSLVGPRPLLVDYLPLYSREQARRHEVLPGITGWAQINGRNQISWETKLAFDVWYVDNRSLWLDLRILFLTVWKVLVDREVSREGDLQNVRFTGNNTSDSSRPPAA
jgi:lipopolysaccharide/colanic/teichoic acid biosynthesis glycosyltransferase